MTCQLIPTVRGAPCQNDDLVQQIPLGLKLGRWVKLWHYHTGGRTIQPLQLWHVVAMASEITGYFILFLWDSTVVHSTGFSFSGHNCYVSRAITRTWQTWQTWMTFPSPSLEASRVFVHFHMPSMVEYLPVPWRILTVLLYMVCHGSHQKIPSLC